MLVLSRRKGEKIAIGNDILITVIRSTPDGVKLGIVAPKEMLVIRTELIKEVVKSKE